MNTFEDPFKYSDAPPEWLVDLKRQKARARREKKLGRPVGTWGGRRPGAGTKKRKEKKEPFDLKLNSIQRMNLMEMGEGSLEKGIQAMIDKYL